MTLYEDIVNLCERAGNARVPGRWKPVVNPVVAEKLTELGWQEGRDFWVSPYLPDTRAVAVNLDEFPELENLNDEKEQHGAREDES